MYCIIGNIILVCYLNKKNKTNYLFVLYILLYIVIYNITHNFYNLNYFYQMVNFLNTKSNIFLLLIVYTLLLKNIFKSNNNIIVNILLFLWVFYLNIGLEKNKLIFFFLQNSNSINTNLLNGIMLIHPIILYLFYNIYLLEYKVIYEKKKILKVKHILIKDNKNYFVGGFLIFTAILLGGWWAEQELSWGGWWSWDFVELLAINYFIYYLIFLHKNSNKTLIGNKATFLTKPAIFLVAVIAVRYNIINSIHNFASVESQNQYYYYVLTFLFLLLFLMLVLLLFLKIKTNTVFYILIGVFTVSFLFHVIDGFGYLLFIKINLLNNIKVLYIGTLLLTLTLGLVYRRTVLNKHNFLFLLGFLILDLTPLKLVDIFGIVLVLLFLKKSKTLFQSPNSNINLIHTSLIFLLVLANNQIYNFIPIKKLISSCDIFTQVVNNFLINNQHTIFIGIDFKKNISDFTSGSFKNIFEKDMSNLNNNLIELYNYNHQILIQIYGNSIIIMFFVLVVCFFKTILFKSKLILL